ncbi:MAG: hypothetical protein ACE1Y4_03635, partial [Lysobacterales bacterium]
MTFARFTLIALFPQTIRAGAVLMLVTAFQGKPAMKSKTLKRTFNTVFLASLLMILGASAPSQAAGKNKAWTDPKAASREDPDFLIQGEYGSVKTGVAVGVQVVARGQGKFDAYLLQDGLPGLGWTREKKRTMLKGTRDGDTVTFASTDKKTTAMIRDGKFLIAGQNPKAVSLPRIERRSPTLAAKPPKGAQVLFDGSSAEH